MEGIRFPVYFTSAVLLLYVTTAALEFPYAVIFWLFVLVNGLLIWMVYRVLKDGKPSEKSFEEVFYEDWDYKRNN